MRTLEQVNEEIAALRAAIKIAWTERNECTDLVQSRKIRLGLTRRKTKLEHRARNLDRRIPSGAEM